MRWQTVMHEEQENTYIIQDFEFVIIQYYTILIWSDFVCYQGWTDRFFTTRSGIKSCLVSVKKIYEDIE